MSWITILIRCLLQMFSPCLWPVFSLSEILSHGKFFILLKSSSSMIWSAFGTVFFFNLFFYWRIIALQNFVVFCQTSTWISHRYTYRDCILKSITTQGNLGFLLCYFLGVIVLHFTLTSVGASLIAQMLKNLSAMQETLVQLLGQEDPLEKG